MRGAPGDRGAYSIGAVLDHPGGVLDHPEAVLDHPEAVLDHPGAVLDHPGAVLGYFEPLLARLRALRLRPRSSVGVTESWRLDVPALRASARSSHSTRMMK